MKKSGLLVLNGLLYQIFWEDCTLGGWFLRVIVTLTNYRHELPKIQGEKTVHENSPAGNFSLEAVFVLFFKTLDLMYIYICFFSLRHFNTVETPRVFLSPNPKKADGFMWARFENFHL